MNQGDISLLVVTCRRDIHQAIIAIKSFERFLIKKHTIHVVINERQQETVNRVISDINHAIHADSLRNEIRIYGASEFVDLSTNEVISKYDGWLDQQILKLVASKFIGDEKILVMDSKLFLINECNAEDLNYQEKVKIDTHPYHDTFRLYAQKYNCTLPEYAPQFTTPFLFEKPVIEHIFQLFTLNELKQFFYSHWKASEFILYNIVSWKINHISGITLTDTTFDAGVYIFWAPFKAGEKLSTYDEDMTFFISNMKSKNILVGGLHRFAWVEMSPEEKQRYVSILADIGLINNTDVIFEDVELETIKENLEIKRKEVIENQWN
jgi:hypothetical protein